MGKYYNFSDYYNLNQDQQYIADEYAIMFQNGDERGLSFFYNEFYAALALYANRWIDNRSVAEEIASEVFVKTWRMHYKLDSYGAIRAYLYKIVYRDSMNALTKESKRRTGIKGLQLSDLNNDTPFDNMVRSETYRLVHKALKDLTPGERRVMVMYYLDGKSTGAIARELNLHTSTIRTQKQNGLKALRKNLGLNMQAVHLLYSFAKRLFKLPVKHWKDYSVI